MEKTINSIRFVPLSQMTERDWAILDWEFLRNKARNRIAAMIVAGTLKGFYHVNVLMKARAKPDYYWPADDDEAILDTDTADFFRHEADDEFETNDVENVDGMIIENALLTPAELVALLSVLAAYVMVHDEISDEDAEYIEDLLDQARETGRLFTWQHLPLAVYIYRLWGLPEWERVLDKIARELEREQELEEF